MLMSNGMARIIILRRSLPNPSVPRRKLLPGGHGAASEVHDMTELDQQ
jgi:hypothetical protein